MTICVVRPVHETPNSLVSFTAGRDCFLSSAPESIRMTGSGFDARMLASYWQDDVKKRGDYCELCECQELQRTIDCRGRGLAVPPKSFSESWFPRKLDLSNNPTLIFVGRNAFRSISNELEELILPTHLQYLSKDAVVDLHSQRLSTLRFGDAGSEGHQLKNAITKPDGSFGDVCCDRGTSVDLFYPGDGLTFCDMQFDKVGADAVYLPFIHYFQAATISTLRPSSDFMAEAAESPEHCAEYCQLLSGCKYFTYDARYGEAEHSCYLAVSPGLRPDFVCCEPTSYADLEQTRPGWTSGYPARTRHEIDNARVVIRQTPSAASEANEYEAQYEVSLGSIPFRGAVWVTPKLISSTTFDVDISPERVVLYDNTTVVTVYVKVKNPSTSERGASLAVSNIIESCDAAFEASSMDENTILINVEVPGESVIWSAGLVAGFVILFVGSLITMFFLNERRRKHSDLIWKVKTSELHFDDPPVVIGQGTFGVVLLAEYHGTQVAIKRVLPPKGPCSPTNSHKSLSSLPAEDCRLEHRADIENGAPKFHGGLMSRRTEKSSTTMSNDAMHRSLTRNFVQEIRSLSKLRHPNITTLMGKCA